MLVFTCPLCGVPDVLRQDVKGRPYFTCQDCRIRIFAPVEPGQTRLVKASKRAKRKSQKES